MEEKKNSELKGNSFKKIRNKYILKIIFGNIQESKLFRIVNYNKNIQKRLDKNLKDYIKYYKKIILEIIPINKNDKNTFINYKEKQEQYFHIYFNDEKEEKYRNYFNKDENVTKIKIIIDGHIRSFYGLFYDCVCIEKINFTKFNRKDIINMSNMFYECSSLKELKLNNFNTNNVKNMRSMFSGCSSLKELNLNSFNTNNITNMS